MVIYDYKSGKRRVQNILNNKLEVNVQNKIPSEKEFTFENAYFGWVSAIFVDIRNSSALFIDEDREKVSKIIRSFTSEIIEILRDDCQREIGIRGDCVYAIYTTPNQDDVYEISNKAVYINTYMKMLNALLKTKGFPEIAVGIGMSTDKELVVKAGRKDVGINNLVWIGKAVTLASKLSSLGNKNGRKPIVFSSCSYSNIIDKYVTLKGESSKSWFKLEFNTEYGGNYYLADIIYSEFDNWIMGGMKD